MKSKAADVLAEAIEAAAAPLPQGGPGARPDQLLVVRRILKARAPAALEELEAGMVQAAKGETELVAWLARPLPRAEPIDPLEAATRALETASAWVTQLPPTHPKAAQFLTLIGGLAKTAERINGGRTPVVTADEVTDRIAARRDDAVRKILEYTGEARAKLAADRAAFVEWARTNLGPMIADELARRLDAMLGATT